jgi:hypothetical protein
MPGGYSEMLRSLILGSFTTTAIAYAGIVAIGCVRLDSIRELPAVALSARPCAIVIFAPCLSFLTIYGATILSVAKRNLHGTGVSLTQFMSSSLEERHALRKSPKRGPYRHA